MKIIVVSSPESIENEAAIINALFEEGLELFHLRKPEASEKEIAELIEKINEVNHSKIVLHQQHQLSEWFVIKRIHFSEAERLKLKEEELAILKIKGLTLSTSIHDWKEVDKLPVAFSYAFLGPVFESISKPGYKPKEHVVLENKNRKTKIIAIGGITFDRLSEIEKRNFDGAALLGAIWTDTKNAVNNFKQCNQNANM